jgi:hypothetical protein
VHILADTRAYSHLYVNDVNKMITKVVMFDILEYFVTLMA